MDLNDSDEEELPTNLDLTTGHDLADLTASTIRSSTLTDRTISQLLPPSPKTARKRTNEEIYQRPHLPRASTTPLKSPPKKMSHFEELDVGTIPADSQTTAVETQVETQASTQQLEREKLTEQPRTFVQDVQAYQEQLEEAFKHFEKSLIERDKKEPLEDLDWDGLELRYQTEIGPKEADEHAIMEELQTRFQQFFLWMQVSKGKESDRAIKRMRTRAAYVQNSEQQLLQRQDHFSKVLEAFNSAMKLLSYG